MRFRISLDSFHNFLSTSCALKKLAKQAHKLFCLNTTFLAYFALIDVTLRSLYLPTKNRRSLSWSTWNAPFTKNVIELLLLCIILAEIFSFWTSFHVWVETNLLSSNFTDVLWAIWYIFVRILPGKRKKYQIRERKCNIFHFRPLITQQSWNVLTTCCCKKISKDKNFSLRSIIP